MTGKSVAIIGAGLSGLSAGVYSQLNGYDTTIYELNSNPGGVAACWRRGDYLIDGGIHFVGLNSPEFRVFRLYKELGLDEVPMKRMELYARYIDQTSGVEIDITNDLDTLRNELVEISPDDTEHIDVIMSCAESFAKMDATDFGYDKPAELMGLKDKMSEMWQMRGFMKFMMGDFSLSVRKFTERIKNPVIKEFLQYLFLPSVPVWFIGMVLGQLTAGQMAILEEGSQSFYRAIENRFIELGGRIQYNSEVVKILIESDRAKGVRLKDESEHKADYVVPAMDTHSTIYELLEGQYINESITNRHENWKVGDPLLMINYGINREFPDEPWMALWKTETPIEIANKSLDYLFVRIFNYGRGFSPKGKTVVQVENETHWKYWHDLRVSDIEAYNAEKKRIAQDVLLVLEQRFPRISTQVEVTDVATPYTTWRYTRNREGAYMGWKPTKNLLTLRLKKTLPGLSNCYLAGQWIMGMGGVLPSLYSGRHAIQLICHHEKKRFST